MSLQINWHELLANDAWQIEFKQQIETILQEKVNHKLPGEIDDGTRVHLLEFHLGDEPPSVELLKLGMDEEGTALSTTIQSNPEDIKEESTDEFDHDSPSFNPGRSSFSSASSSPSPSSHSSTPSLPMTPRSTAIRQHAKSIAAASRCSQCHRRVPVSTLPLPSVNLRGRISYFGSSYITLQIRRQVNPFVSTRGLMGRLGRFHHATNGADWPMTAEIWVRVSELDIACELQATYIPAQKAVTSGRRPPAASATAGSSTSNSLMTTPQRSVSPSPSPSPMPHSRSHSSARHLSGSQSHGRIIIPSTTPSPSPMTNVLDGPCNCPPSSSTAGRISSPAILSLLLESNPIHHLTVTTSLDGSPAGDKIRSVIQTQLTTALNKIVGQRIQITLPTPPPIKL